MNKIKVAAYCRVSTDFDDQFNSLSAQIKYFTEYISNHENYELIEVYYDEGVDTFKSENELMAFKNIFNC